MKMDFEAQRSRQSAADVIERFLQEQGNASFGKEVVGKR
jgi:hypothetical protein